MGADLNNIVKTQRLTDDHVQFLVYQILRGLKVSPSLSTTAAELFVESLFIDPERVSWFKTGYSLIM